MNVSNGDLMMIDGAEHALTLTYGKNVKALYEQSECFFFCSFAWFFSCFNEKIGESEWSRHYPARLHRAG
jgi:hypothetical protein